MRATAHISFGSAAMAVQTTEALLLVIILAHLVGAPFTKVEESFNMQAMHDMLFHRFNLSAYDHNEFPGVVPRTFSGAAAVAGASVPLAAAAYKATGSKLLVQMLVRAVLGVGVWTSMVSLRRAVTRTLGKPTGDFLALLTAVQFHLPFYATRPLPNTLALALCNWAAGEWIKGQRPVAVVYMLAFTATVVRCDVLLLAAPVGLHMLLTRALSLPTAIIHGTVAVAGSLLLTVPLDSYLWRRRLWPEGEVFLFNAVAGRSTEWGTSPWHWYFSSALPRALLAALPMAVLGAALERRVRPQVLVAFVYVLMYSKLEHKEVRFLYPVLMLFNLGAAAFLSRVAANRRKSWVWRLLYLGCLAGLVGSFAVKLVMTLAANANYPGGVAFLELHTLHEARVEAAHCAGGGKPVRVHIDVLPAMTGVTRFGEAQGGGWSYDKTEGLSERDMAARRYDYLLSGKEAVAGYTRIATIEGFDRLSRTSVIATKPAVFIHALVGDVSAALCAK